MTKALAIEVANKQIRRVTLAGIWTNSVLTLLKITIGYLVGSISLIADGIHSLSDFATDFALLIGVHLASKQPDEKHQFGHGRLETFAGAFVAVALMTVGSFLIYKGAQTISNMHRLGNEAVQISSWVIWIALLSVISKEALYQATRVVAKRTHSSATYANAWHHRSDAFSSVAVIIGAAAVKFGYPHGDQLGAIAVGIMIILVGAKIVLDCFSEFAEGAVDSATQQQIQEVISEQQGVRQWHQLRTRTVGREVFLDLHILVDPALNITEAHEIADSLEKTLVDRISRPVNVVIHIEPDLPTQRK